MGGGGGRGVKGNSWLALLMWKLQFFKADSLTKIDSYTFWLFIYGSLYMHSETFDCDAIMRIPHSSCKHCIYVCYFNVCVGNTAILILVTSWGDLFKQINKHFDTNCFLQHVLVASLAPHNLNLQLLSVYRNERLNKLWKVCMGAKRDTDGALWLCSTNDAASTV